MSATTIDERTLHPAVAALADDAATLAGAADGIEGWAAVDALLAVQQVVGRLTAVCARLLATVEADGLWAVTGGRSVTDWLAVSTGTTHRTARDLVTLARALRDHLPRTAEAAVRGEVPVAHAQALARIAPTSEVRQAALAAPAEECGEGFLLAQARRLPADAFRTLVRRWAAAADPESDERGYREACDREFVALSPTTGGVHLAGFLTSEHGAVLDTALRAVTGPPAEGDRRTTQQRRAQGLTDLARLALDHGLVGTGAAVRPHLSVVVDYETLGRALTAPRADAPSGATGGPAPRRGAASSRAPSCRLAPVADVERFAVAEILGCGPVPASVLARLACDSEVSRLVFGPDSQVIDTGRAERTFSGPRRRAIIARDQTCRYPGCHAPPALGELHHLDWWARDGGDTDVNRGILLCWHHHEVVHRLEISIERSPTGGWVFRTRHGDVVTG